jgi:hypothetical protein
MPVRRRPTSVGLRATVALLATILFAIGGCNDGSTGCCMVCNGSCACGDMCQDCAYKCTLPHGCACSPMEMLAEERRSIAEAEPLSQPPDASAPASEAVCSSPAEALDLGLRNGRRPDMHENHP